VPIYQTDSPEQCEYVLAHSEVRLVFCEDESQLAKIEQVKARCPGVEQIVLFESASSGAMSLADLRDRGRAVKQTLIDECGRAVAPQDVATIVYTSGTTGPPKGCMLTHENLLATVEMYRQQLALSDPPVIYLFLPLAHALARVTQMLCIDAGGTLAYWGGDPRRIADELAESRPTHFPTVPRVLEKIRAQALSTAEEQGRFTSAVFRRSLARGAEVRRHERDGSEIGVALRLRHALADRLALSRVRAVFGERLEAVLTGAAAIDLEVLAFLDGCGVPVLEGYGMTETCAAATLNTARAVRFGTVGKPLPGVEIRIAKDAEILLRGPNVFPGYLKDPAATEEAFTDGWLRTGDLGAIDDGFLTITGRKKELIITSSGKNISPKEIEQKLRQTPLVSDAVVYGDRRPYLVALVTLDSDAAARFAARIGIPADLATMAHDDRVRAEIEAAVDAVNTHFARIEQIKRFAILDHALSQPAGELTPTMKVKRPVVYARYHEILGRPLRITQRLGIARAHRAVSGSGCVAPCT
jgi:long-chain acyl-CoA synthetase